MSRSYPLAGRRWQNSFRRRLTGFQLACSKGRAGRPEPEGHRRESLRSQRRNSVADTAIRDRRARRHHDSSEASKDGANFRTFGSPWSCVGCGWLDVHRTRDISLRWQDATVQRISQGVSRLEVPRAYCFGAWYLLPRCSTCPRRRGRQNRSRGSAGVTRARLSVAPSCLEKSNPAVGAKVRVVQPDDLWPFHHKAKRGNL